MADDYGRMRQLEAMNEAIDSNRRIIGEMAETRKADHAEIMVTLAELREAMYGNGMPEHGIRYRVSWSERLLKILLIAVGAELVVLLIVAIMLISHLT